MNYSSPIPTRAPKVRRVRKRRKKAKNGRLYIFLLFLWLRAIDAATLFFLYPRLSVVYQRHLIVFLVAIAVWTTILLVAIWFRQHWAKFLLAGSLLLVVASTLALIPGLPDSADPQKQLGLSVGVTVAFLPVALMLILSKSIQKLTHTKYGELYE